MKRLQSLTIVSVAVVVLLLPAAASAARSRTTGELRLEASFALRYQFGDFCLPGTPTNLACIRFLGEATVPGLGRASVTYLKTLDQTAGDCPVTQFATAVIAVAGKGEIRVVVPRIVCGPTAPAGVGPFEVVVAGGSGVYAGASGTLQFRSQVGRPDLLCGPCGKARDTWAGILDVPGLTFDVTAPVLTGARSKTVRAAAGAKRIRVRYAPIAADIVDGSVPVSCTPRSGSVFKLGRTTVACTATDSSGNTSRARFSITVR